MELKETLAGLTDLRSLYRTLDGAIQLVRNLKFPGSICYERLPFACCAYTKALLHEWGAIKILFIPLKRFGQIFDSFNIYLNWYLL